MAEMGFLWLLVIAVLVLVGAATIKDLFFDKQTLFRLEVDNLLTEG